MRNQNGNQSDPRSLKRVGQNEQPPDPPPPPNNGGSSSSGLRDEDRDFTRDSGGRKAPPDGDGTPPGSGPGAVSIARDAASGDKAESRKNPKVKDFSINSHPNPSNREHWALEMSVKIGNSYPEDVSGVERHYYQIARRES